MEDTCVIDQNTVMTTATKLFKDQFISPFLELSVILPVRNEEENLARTLDALRLQVDLEGKSLSHERYEVLLLANNCTDQSLYIALNYQRTFPEFALHIEKIELQVKDAHIGTVRRLLMDAAYDRFERIGRPLGVIASTDSDSEVDKKWVIQTLKEINSGNDVVGGRILTKPANSIARIYYLRDITYKHLVAKLEDLIDPLVNDPWPRHFQCFGASFAVTCLIYDRSGRMPVVPFLEDMAFQKSLIRVDAKIRLSPLVRVITSDRISGRVDFGLSIQLKQWGEMTICQQPLLVEAAGSLIKKLVAKKMLRLMWSNGKKAESENDKAMARIAEILDLDLIWMTEQFRSEVYFGTLWDGIEEKLNQIGWSERWPFINIVDAIPELRREIGRIGSGSLQTELLLEP